MNRSALVVLWMVGACAPPDPQQEAWHGAIEIEEAFESYEDCAAEPEPIDPYARYLFIAVDRGLPDLATLYWCDEPEQCPSPLASVWVKTLELTHLDGDRVQSDLHGSLCSTEWTDLTANQEGGRVDLTARTGIRETVVDKQSDCEALEASALGESCTAVLRLVGTRVEP